MQSGGNAIDAAIAASAVQCVVELPWCGVAGDAFVAVRSHDGQVLAINGSGAAPASIEAAAGRSRVPRFGPLSVGTPGLAAAWQLLHERFGSVAFADLMTPAAEIADEGFELDERLASALTGAIGGPDAGNLGELVRGQTIEPGRRFRLPDLAATLRRIGIEGPDDLYTGALAKQIADTVQSLGGCLSTDDLAAHRSDWLASVSDRYRDTVVHTQPPVSMGCILITELRLLAHFDVATMTPNSPELIDLMVRCKHTAFALNLDILGDPGHVGVPIEAMLSDDVIAEHAERIRTSPTPMVPITTHPNVIPTGADTTGLAIADGNGTVVSFVHSLFNEFGARVVVPGTDLVLNDRLANLIRDANHPNGLRGGRRPIHTLHTYIAERDDGRVVAGATPGGRGQVQTNLQVLVNMVDFGFDVQDAVDQPRWVSGKPRRSPPDNTLYLESSIAPATVEALTRLGHEVEQLPGTQDDHFGNCTVIATNTQGEASAAADKRRGAAAVAW